LDTRSASGSTVGIAFRFRSRARYVAIARARNASIFGPASKIIMKSGDMRAHDAANVRVPQAVAIF